MEAPGPMTDEGGLLKTIGSSGTASPLPALESKPLLENSLAWSR